MKPTREYGKLACASGIRLHTGNYPMNQTGRVHHRWINIKEARRISCGGKRDVFSFCKIFVVQKEM